MNIVYGGNEAFDGLLYGNRQNRLSFDYFRKQIEDLDPRLTDLGRKFMEECSAIFDKLNWSKNVVEMAVRSSKTMFDQYKIMKLETPEQIRSANITNQRWIMASPDVRALYHKQLCDGYSDTYVDMYPNDIGENHYDYRLITDGVIMEDTVDGEDSYYYKHHLDELVDGDTDLTHLEKMDILTTLDYVRIYFEQGLDVTNPYGGNL